MYRLKFFMLMLLTAVVAACGDDGGNDDNNEEDAGNGEQTDEISEIAITLTDFELKSATLVDADGEEVSTTDFEPEDWYPVTVPTTVLSGLVANDVYPDPYVGLNNLLIPDSNDEFNEENDLAQYSHLGEDVNPWAEPYYFRTVFELTEAFEDKQVWLTFNGINYRADVYVNGKLVADSDEIAGMFGSHKINITKQAVIGEDNVLAVAIHPVDEPGLPSAPPLYALGNGSALPGAGGNCGIGAEIAKNVTMHCTLGWDWIPAIRDRNMGIWQDVVVSATLPVDLRNSWVETDLPLPDLAPAQLFAETELENPLDEEVKGELTLRISPATFEGDVIEISKTITLDAEKVTSFTFAPDDFEELEIEEPTLWWPYMYGNPDLYEARFTFTVDGQVSDTETIRFGIREISTEGEIEEVDLEDRVRRIFYVNGQRLHLRGGAWVPDMMLNRDAKRFAQELRYAKEANLNTVRVWGGGVTPPKSFFDLADEMGLMVWTDFWITGDGQGTWPPQGSREWPLDNDLFLYHAENVVKRVRHHASHFVWTGGNEGFASADLYLPLRETVIDNDGTRPFIPSTGWADAEPEDITELAYPDDMSGGIYSGGPYKWESPSMYFALVSTDFKWLHNNEVGVPALPPVRSLEKFITDFEPDDSEVTFPLNAEFAYHDTVDAEWGNPTYSAYHKAISDRYGAPETLDDYAEKAQFVTYETMKALFEAVNTQLNYTGGLLIWKLNSAWPSALWQLYDWYLRPNAGFYAVKQTNELLTVQLDQYKNDIVVCNRTMDEAKDLTVDLTLLDLDWEVIFEDSVEVGDVDPETTETAMEWELTDEEGIVFVKLDLRDADGEIIYTNYTWMEADDDFSAINDLPSVALDVTASSEIEDGELVATVAVENPSETLAFFVHLHLLEESEGEEILPAYWSNNYVLLPPGESVTLTVAVDEEAAGDDAVVSVEGFNIETAEVSL